jgi:hypothetical protein
VQRQPQVVSCRRSPASTSAGAVLWADLRERQRFRIGWEDPFHSDGSVDNLLGILSLTFECCSPTRVEQRRILDVCGSVPFRAGGPGECGPRREPWDEEAPESLFRGAPQGRQIKLSQLRRSSTGLCRPCRGSSSRGPVPDGSGHGPSRLAGPAAAGLTLLSIVRYQVTGEILRRSPRRKHE